MMMMMIMIKITIDNEISGIVKKSRIFYGHADRKGGGVSLLGADLKQM